jgi:hypothetical protein
MPMNSSTADKSATTTPKLRPAATFYCLWRIGGARPRRRHNTIESALRERGRLRALHSDATFQLYRMELIDTVSLR